jgi:hypothetical protein
MRGRDYLKDVFDVRSETKMLIFYRSLQSQCLLDATGVGDEWLLPANSIFPTFSPPTG